MKEIPKKYRDLVGTRKILQGGVFSRRKSIEPTDFDIVGIRMSSQKIMNLKTRKTYRAFELLVKNDSMQRARWTNPFPIKDVIGARCNKV